jgi:hypothetical protein
MEDIEPRMPVVFEVNLSGEGIFPESIRASELADILKSIEKAVTAVATQADSSLDSTNFIIGLVQIEKGSARLAFSSSQPSIAKSSFNEVTNAVSQKKVYRLPQAAVEEVERMADFSKRKGCVIELRPDIQQAPTTFIQPDTDLGLQETPTFSSDSVVFGKLERIGGKKPMARIRISEHDALSCSISLDLAKTLATRLYENVGLTGRATWNTETWSLIAFNIHGITPYEGGPIKEAFRELAEAAGDAWADVEDVKTYIRSLRED